MRSANNGDESRSVQPLSERVIELAWLVGLIAVPILFTPRRFFTFHNDPKYFVVHLVGVVIVVAWAFKWAATRRHAGGWGLRTPWSWAGRRPERWAVFAAGLLAAAAVLSTIASPAPRVSLWGRDYLGLGYELYSFLVLLAVFVGVALFLKNLQQAGRVFMALVVVGGITSLYGISQHLGWDPFTPGEDYDRNFASFGNPIFFGSFLVMSSIATIAVALEARRSGRMFTVFLATAVLGIQLAGLWTSESRGPLLGLISGLVAFGAIGLLWLDRRTVLNALAVISIGLVIAVAISLLPAGDADAVSRNLEDLGDIFDSEQTTSIGGRATTWEGALKLATTWERWPEESTLRHALRPVVGLGPDMYFYSYPLSIDNDPTKTGIFFAHVHNYPLQLLLELGLLGFISFISLALFVVYSAVLVLRSEKRSGRSDGLLAIFTAVLLSALVGRAVEQMSGVAHVSDLMAFWVIAGLVVALARIAQPSERLRESPSSLRPLPHASADPLIGRAALGIAVAVLIAGVAIFFMRDVRGIGASRVAAQGFELIKDGESQAGLGKYERAVDLNPEIELYALQVDFMIRSEAEIREDPAQKISLNEISLAVLERYEDRDPFAHATQRRIAKTELALGRLGQTERFESAVERYIKLAEEMRSFPTMQALAGDGIVAAGDGLRGVGDTEQARAYTETGLFYADRAVSLDPESERGWWVRGVALERLGSLDDAVESYLESLTWGVASFYETEAHKGLARVYGELGDADAAAEHQRLADETDQDQ